jgi:hypothetical protein
LVGGFKESPKYMPVKQKNRMTSCGAGPWGYEHNRTQTSCFIGKEIKLRDGEGLTQGQQSDMVLAFCFSLCLVKRELCLLGNRGFPEREREIGRRREPRSLTVASGVFRVALSWQEMQCVISTISPCSIRASIHPAIKWN